MLTCDCRRYTTDLTCVADGNADLVSCSFCVLTPSLEKALAFYEILRAGGYTTGGTNFDAKVRRQSLDPEDLILAHVGGMDTCARALKAAAALLESDELEANRRARYAGWDAPAAQAMLQGSLEQAADRVLTEGLEPQPRSGRQERLENLWNRYI